MSLSQTDSHYNRPCPLALPIEEHSKYNSNGMS